MIARFNKKLNSLKYKTSKKSFWVILDFQNNHSNTKIENQIPKKLKAKNDIQCSPKIAQELG